jgi:two-component system response regulator RegA
VLDLNLAGESGLQLLPELLALQPGLEVLVLTGYGSIATAVEAMRRGAVNYLCKPVTLSQLTAGFSPLDGPPATREEPPTVEEMEWEHIQRVLNAHDGNVSSTARALNMHRQPCNGSFRSIPAGGISDAMNTQRWARVKRRQARRRSQVSRRR